MPVLQDVRKTKTISLSNYEGSEIIILDSVMIGDVIDIPDENSLDRVSKLIKSWNFTDVNGKDLPINSDSLKILDSESFSELMKKTMEFNKMKKKD